MNGQASTNQELMNTKSVLDLESLNPPSSTTYPIRIASLWPKSRNFPSSQPVSLASFFTFLFSSFLLRAWPCTETSLCSFDGGPSLRLSASASAPSAACTGCSRRGSKTQRRQLHAGAKKTFLRYFSRCTPQRRPDTVGTIRTSTGQDVSLRAEAACAVLWRYPLPRRQARLSQSVRGGEGKRKLRRSRGERDKRNKI